MFVWSPGPREHDFRDNPETWAKPDLNEKSNFCSKSEISGTAEGFNFWGGTLQLIFFRIGSPETRDWPTPSKSTTCVTISNSKARDPFFVNTQPSTSFRGTELEFKSPFELPNEMPSLSKMSRNNLLDFVCAVGANSFLWLLRMI